MIVQMKKITLVCLDRDRESTLQELRDLGVVHLLPITDPQGADVEAARHKLAIAREAADAIKRATREGPKPAARHDPGASAPAVVADVENLVAEQTELTEEAHGLLQEKTRAEPFGEFDPQQFEDLHHMGLTLRLCRYTVKDPINLPAGADQFILGKHGDTTYALCVSQSPISFPGHEVAPPQMSLSRINTRLDEIGARQADIAESLCAMASGMAGLNNYVADLSDDVTFAEAKASMGRAERIAYLQGYCPADDLARVEQASERQGCAIVAVDPVEDDTVPTLLRSPGWVRPIKAVLDIIKITPGYREQDISTVFLLFFSIFFAMLIGDAGYGLLVLAGTWFARYKMRSAPAYPFTMLTVLSICTIIWGTLTGNYFGIPSRFAPLGGMQINWLRERDNVMSLCFLIGAIHMTIAHTWRFLLLQPNKRCLEQVGWIGVLWSAYFIARKLVTQTAWPSFMFAMLGIGVALIVLFKEKDKDLKIEAINMVMLPLALVGSLVDVISYIRLFAVGMASLAVAQSFNDMALGVGFNNVLVGLASALILLAGHTLNIILCGLAVLVHGVRLNTLEYSMHMGLEWSGMRFNPFGRLNRTEK